MKLAQVCHVYFPHIGGIEIYVNKIYNGLMKKEIKSKVITTDFQTPIKNRKNEAIYFRTSFSIMNTNPVSLDMINHFRKNSYDILHLHSVWFMPTLIATFFRKNAKIIISTQGVYPEKASFIQKVLLRAYLPIAQYIVRKADFLIVDSNSEKIKAKNVFRAPDKKILVIPNSIIPEKKLRVKTENYILFTGRIIPDKNPDLLIRACGFIKDKIKKFKILFVGPVEKEYKKYLIELSKKEGVFDRVEFLPPIPLEERPKLMNIYRKASIFVSIGSWEGLPARLMEAMQFGVPCVAYESGGSAELIKDGENGLLLKKLDLKDLSNKILKLIENKELYQNISKKSVETISKKYNWENNFKKLFELYKIK